MLVRLIQKKRNRDKFSTYQITNVAGLVLIDNLYSLQNEIIKSLEPYIQGHYLINRKYLR